jgi:hypothetical protein
MSIQAMSSPSKRLARSPQNLTKNQIFLKKSAPRGRIALPAIENVPRKMRDTASETLALPDEEAASSISTTFDLRL